MFIATKIFLLSLSVFLLSFMWIANGQSGLSADIGDKRYFIVTGQKRNWYQANMACSAMGMSLAAIESETENTNLRNYLYNQNHLSDTFWLSGSNLADTTNTDFTWLSNGNKLSYTNWQSQQPTKSAGLCIYTDAQFKWSTESCATSTALKYFICSRPLVPNCGITGRCKRNRNFFF